jgi:transcriptional regulator with XRE-family HTH domain
MPKEKPLLARTKDLLEQLHGDPQEGKFTYEDIADGAKVGREWLAKFAIGQIPEPGVNKVQRVHDFLSRASAQ